jgi:hypothetical protein
VLLAPQTEESALYPKWWIPTSVRPAGCIGSGVAWTVFLASATFGARTLRTWHRRRKKSCPRCGYQILQLRKCPECGAPKEFNDA